MESELIETVVAALEQLGYRYDVSGGRAPFLWCLGGVEVLVHPDDGEDDDEWDESCVDLTVYACEQHEVIDVDLWPHTLTGTNGSDPLELGVDWSTARSTLSGLLDEFLAEHLHPHSD